MKKPRGQGMRYTITNNTRNINYFIDVYLTHVVL